MKRRWTISRLRGDYRVELYEYKWWVEPLETIASPILELACRIHQDRICESVNSVAQWLFRVADKGEYHRQSVVITKEVAGHLSPEMVDLFEDDD